MSYIKVLAYMRDHEGEEFTAQDIVAIGGLTTTIDTAYADLSRLVALKRGVTRVGAARGRGKPGSAGRYRYDTPEPERVPVRLTFLEFGTAASGNVLVLDEASGALLELVLVGRMDK